MKTKEYKKLWVAEYNPNDGNFHIQTLAETLQGNIRAAMEGRVHTYLLLGVFATSEEAYVACDIMANSLKAAGQQVAV